MALRINTLFNIRYIPRNASYVNASFYEYTVDTIRKCSHLTEFPIVDSKSIYRILRQVTQPEAEKLYPNFTWKYIWTNICFKFINIYDRQVMFKFLHEILPNKKKLNQWYNSDPNCGL